MARRTKRAAIYMRVSTRIQEENYSFEVQSDKTHAHCQEQGYEVVMVEQDTHTGFELDERQGLTRIRDAVSRRTIDVIVVVHLDRLARNQTHQEVLFYETCRRDIEIEAVEGEKFDDTPIGRHIRHTLGFVAEMERLDIIRRTTGGKRKRAERGENMPAFKPPYGYLFADETKQHLIPDPETAPIIERLFHEVAQGIPMRQIVKALNAEGILCPTDYWRARMGRDTRGRVWHSSTLHGMLASPIYTGQHAAYRYQVTKARVYDALTGESRTVRRMKVVGPEESIPQPGVAPALVEGDLAEAAKQRLRLNKQNAVRNNKFPDKCILRGFVYCGYCGLRLRTGNYIPTSIKHRTNPHRVFRYFCPMATHHHIGRYLDRECEGTAIQENQLDPFVWSIMRQVIDHPETISERVADYAELTEVHEGTIELFEQQVRDIGRQQTNLTNVLAKVDDEDAQAPILSKLKLLVEQKRQALQEITNRKAWQASREAYQQQLHDLELWCKAIAPQFDRLDTEQKQLILYSFNVRIIVWNTTHTPRIRVILGNETDPTILESQGEPAAINVPLWSLLEDVQSRESSEGGDATENSDCVQNTSMSTRSIRRERAAPQA